MLSCKEVTELCSQEQERSLRLGEQLPMGAHLMMCSGCRNFRRQMKTLRQVMRAYADGLAITTDSAGPTSAERDRG